MTSAVLIAFLPCLLFAIALSYSPALGRLRSSALNPMLLVTLFIVLAAADFASMVILGYGVLGSRIVVASQVELFWITLQYTAMVFALLLGMAAVMHRPQLWANRPRISQAVNIQSSLAVFYIACLLFWFISIRSVSTDFFSIEGTWDSKYYSQGNQLIYAASLLLLPSLSFALPRQPYRVALPLVLVTLVLMFFSGSRSRILYTLVPFAFYLVVVRGVRIQRKWFGVGVLILGFLALSALNLRFVVSQGEAVSSESVLRMSNPFNTPDLAIAEVATVLPNLPPEALTPYPGDAIVSMVLAPVPRSIASFKPESGSVQFTRAYDARRWRQVGSGLTIGGVNELRYDYPFPIALVVILLFGAAWALATIKAVRSNSIYGFAWTVGLYVFISNFFRGDLFIAGGVLFAFAFYSALVAVYQGVLQMFGVDPAPRGVPVPKPRPTSV